MKKVFLIVIALFTLASVEAQSSFLKIEGIEGESTDNDHKGWSDLLSFSQAIHKPGGGAVGQSRRRGGVILEDLVVVKELDKSSPKLQEAVCNGKVFPKAEIHLTNSMGRASQPYLTYELKNVSITSYNISGANGEVPQEEVSINFEEIKVVYTTFDAQGKKKGNVEYSWKVEKGSK